MSAPALQVFRQPFRLRPADFIFPLVTLFFILAARLGLHTSSPVILALLVAGVVFSGLPHGSLDPLVARNLFSRHRRFTMLRFLLAYLLLAAACVAGWLAVPSFALAVFLVVSAIHFGSDWQGRGDRWGRAAYGFCIVALPSLRHAADVRQIFTALGATNAAVLVSGLRALAAVAIVLALISLFRHSNRFYRDSLEFAAILAGGLLLPPLVFFICYFCLLHSPRHLRATSTEVGLRGAWAIFAAVAPVVLVTLALAALVWHFLPSSDVSSRVLQIVFIGLAALTVPHMLLTALDERERRRFTQSTPTLA